MPTCGEILEYLEGYMPLSLAEDFDNVGLLVGRHSTPVKKALLCLNANLFTAKEAVQTGADLIISHHPLTFSGEKKITEDTVMGETYLTLMENGISVISMHTNFDCAAGGLNDLMAKRLNLTVVEKIKRPRLRTDLHRRRYEGKRPHRPHQRSLWCACNQIHGR